MLKNFRAYQLSVKFYRACEKLPAPRHLHDQLRRAASSIALNLAEGTERGSNVDRRRFYRMAMGSVRECQAILDLVGDPNASEVREMANHLGALVYKLVASVIPPEAGARGPGTEARAPEKS